MDLLIENFVPWIISNILALILVLTARKKTKLARLFFALLFSWASWINYSTAHTTPNVYLEYATFTPFKIYYDFITGWFKLHITEMLSLISIGQALIAIGMLLKTWLLRLACYAAILFFIAIMPLGIGSGFPFGILAIIALYFILKNDNMTYLWAFRAKK